MSVFIILIEEKSIHDAIKLTKLKINCRCFQTRRPYVTIKTKYDKTREPSAECILRSITSCVSKKKWVPSVNRMLQRLIDYRKIYSVDFLPLPTACCVWIECFLKYHTAHWLLKGFTSMRCTNNLSLQSSLFVPFQHSSQSNWCDKSQDTKKVRVTVSCGITYSIICTY